jgi:asparagine synthase (glutamine-hydrolysing)
MCGILGSLPAAPLDLRFLAHRGPDGQGSAAAGDEASMAHTRLAILDLTPRAAQPKWSDDGNVLLSFNGEIYNFRQLTACEEHSDTVALCEWLAASGPGCDLAKLDGMYGFAAYFSKQQALVLARDPAGIKPLYIAVDAAGERLAFSSEIKGFFGVEWFTARPNCDAEIQRQYLQYGYALSAPVALRLLGSQRQLTLVPTLLEGVFQLCPGQKLVLTRQGAVQSATALPAEPFEPLAALESSVRQQSISDVEVGVQLSGGVDSSLVAYEYAKRNGAVHGFYVSIDDRRYNEDRWVHRAAELLDKRFKFRLHTIPATRQEVARVFPSVAWFMDEPAVRHPNAVGVYLLCEYVRARTAVRVLLTGEGADEMFGGYSWHDGRTISGFDKPVRMFDLGGCAQAEACMARHPRLPALARQLYYDREVYMPPILLRQDRMSMAHAIEARVPFLSNRFLAMPPPRVPGKRVLKRQAARVFGLRFAYRRKYGFGFPWDWFSELNVRQEHLAWLHGRWVPASPAQAWTLTAIGLWAQEYLFGGWRKWADGPRGQAKTA